MAPPRQPQDYTLRVTAGPSYDLSTHVEVPINSSRLTHIASEEMDIDLNVRIQNYHRGLPRGSPESSKYFEREPHRYNKDQYSISFKFTPKRPKGVGVTGKPDGGGDGDGNGDGNADGNGKGDQNGSGDGKGKGDANVNRNDNADGDEKGISAANLQFGNDFDHPIRNYLPPGVNTAMNILKWWIDPGLEGDAYADEPYLYGPALSSFNVVRVGRGECDEEGGGLWVEEGASSDEELESDMGEDDGEVDGDEGGKPAQATDSKGTEREKGAGKETKAAKPKKTSSKKWRDEILQGSGVGNDPKKRQKWALKEDAKKKWVWEYGRTYAVDFYNPYIDFGKCELKLPGFGVNVLRYWDGETGLRYVLRNRLTKKPYLVILFVLYPNDMVNEDGTLKPEALKATARASGGGKDEVVNGEKGVDEKGEEAKDGDKFDADKAVEEAKRKLEGVALGEGPKEGAGAAGAGAGDDDVD